MAITPPSDIVLDVAQAADPVKLRAAAEKLSRIAAGTDAAAGQFAKIMDAARSGNAAGAGPGTSPAVMLSNLQRHATKAALLPLDTKASALGAQQKAFQGLEAVLLQTYVDAMLPKNEGFFGDAASGSTTRYFLSQQIATQLAKSGSIGIAKTLAARSLTGAQDALKTAAAVAPDITAARLGAQIKL